MSGDATGHASAKAHRRPNVAVVYHFYPHYRRAVVEELSRSAVADFTFIGDDHEYLHSIKPAELSAAVRFRLAPTHKMPGPFMWQWGAITWAIRPEFDTIIMHAVPHWPCTWIGALLARMFGKRVLFWGHGYLYEPRGLKGLMRRLFYALPHEHLVYGRIAKDIMLRHGWPPERVHVIYNSLDTDAQVRIRQSMTDAHRAATRTSLFGRADMPVAICTTRLIRIRRLDLLIDALHSLGREGHPVALILVGDGPERAALEAHASQLGVRVHFEGACYDERRIAELVSASTVTVAPGKVGLTAMHSMVYGVPVITHSDADDQMPEWEAIIPGVTGALFARDDVASLASAIRDWTREPWPPAATRRACESIIERFWNPHVQRRLIEHAVLRKPADDLMPLRPDST
jgi:glycosyltransferase involved in cell wall biosynthesis